MTAFGSHRVTLDATVLTHVTECRIANREKNAALGNDGNLHISHRNILRASPTIEFTTGDLKTLLTKLTNLEAPAWPLSGNGVVALVPQALATGPGWSAGSTHVQVAMALGILALDRLSWSEGGMATAACTAFGKSSNGTTSPLAQTAVAAPAQGAVGAGFILQTLTVGGVSITDCVRFDLAVSHQLSNEAPACFSLGLPYPTQVLGAGALGAATIELTLEVLDAITAFGNGAVVATFKAKTANSLALGADTVTVTLNTCLVEAVDQQGGSPGSRTIRCLATHDGSNRPMTVGLA